MINIGDDVRLDTNEVGKVVDTFVIVGKDIREMCVINIAGRNVEVPMWSVYKIKGKGKD